MLSTAQTMLLPAAVVGQGDRPAQLAGEALQAASLGAGGAMRTEPISPVIQKSLSKAFRWAQSWITLPYIMLILYKD